MPLTAHDMKDITEHSVFVADWLHCNAGDAL